MTKKELQDSIEQYGKKEAAISVYSTLKKKMSILSGFMKKYNEEKPLYENIKEYLKDSSTMNSFRNNKIIIKRWLSASGIDCNIEDVQFGTTFISSIEELNNTLQKAMNDPNIWSTEVASYCCYVKLMCYLLWAGVNKNNLAQIQKGDYDIRKKILFLEDEKTEKKIKIDLNLEYYSDIAELLHKELCDNIYSRNFIKQKINICGQLREVTTYNENTSVLKVYNCNDYLFRPIFSGNSPSNIVNNTRSVIVPKIYLKLNIIRKSGIWYRVYRYLQQNTGNSTAENNSKQISKALDYFGYDAGRRGIMQEYKTYLDSCAYMETRS